MYICIVKHAKGLTPQLLQKMWIEKWQGVTYGNEPFILKNIK